MPDRMRALAALASVVTLLISSCSAPATPVSAPAPAPTSVGIPAGQTVTIRFDSYNYGAPGIGGKGTQQLIDEFQALYPNIKIQAKNVASTEMLNSAVAQAAAGDPPDVAQLVLNTLEFAVKNLPVQAIDQIAPKAEYDDLVKHQLPQTLRIGQLNGHLYGSPYTFSTPTLFYNADIFRAAGLDPDKPPTTWEQVRQYARQIKDTTGKAGLSASTWDSDWPVQSFVNSNGGSTLSADKTKATFNEPPAIEVYKFFQGMVDDGTHPRLNQADAMSAMLNGTIGMELTSTVLLPAFSQAAQGKWELRTAGEPAFGDKPVVPINSGSALFIMARDPLKQYAAWEFVRFAGSQRGNTVITSVIGYVPQRDDVVDDPNYLKPFLDKEPRMLPAIKQLTSLQTWLSWPGKNANQALSLYTGALNSVVYGGQDAQQTMDTAAARVDALLKDG